MALPKRIIKETATMNEIGIDRRFIAGFRDERARVGDEGNIHKIGTYDKRIPNSDL